MKSQKAKGKKQKYQKSKNLLFFFIFLLFTFCFLLSARYASAQTFSLSIAPPLLEVIVKPGKSITQAYKLQNLGDDTQIWTNIAPFTPTEDGKVKLDLNHTADSVLHTPFLNWFSFQNADRDLPGSFRLPPGETQELILEIQVPEDAPGADYYAALTFQVKPGKNLAGPNLTKASGIITSNILLTVSKTGSLSRMGEISEFKVKKSFCLFNHCFPLFDSSDQINFNLKVDNQDRTLFRPEGEIKIYDIFDKEVGSINVLPQNILAHSTRRVLCQKDEKPTECQLHSKFLVGKFKAQADLKISETDKILQAQAYFFVFPWKLSLGIIVIILVFIAVKKILKI